MMTNLWKAAAMINVIKRFGSCITMVFRYIKGDGTYLFLASTKDDTRKNVILKFHKIYLTKQDFPGR